MRTAFARALDLYKLVTGEAKYDYNNKTVTHGRMYRRDGSYYDPDPYTIDEDEVKAMMECMELAGGDDYNQPAITKSDAIARKLPVYISPDPCKAGHLGLKTIADKCYLCQVSNPRQQAIQAGERWYMPVEPCPHCGQVALKRVQDGKCKGCNPVKPRVMSPRQQAIQAGEKWYMPTEPCPHCDTTSLRRVQDSRCSGCHPKQPTQDRSNSPRQQAIRSGLKWYMPTEPCPHCHKIALKRVQDGLCSGCRPRRTDRATSPRQQAIRSGLKWYMPTDPCPTCGHIAPKRVQDSMCSGCTDSKALQWILSNLDMIVSRDMAAVFGIDVYHEDGEPWKWVKTGKDVVY